MEGKQAHANMRFCWERRLAEGVARTRVWVGGCVGRGESHGIVR